MRMNKVVVNNRMAGFARFTLAGIFGVVVVGLCGCGVAPNGTIAANPGVSVSGRVHGGQQPIANATITLYAPGTTGYGSALTIIVSTTSDANGNFTLPRPYTCPANNGLSVLRATGGNAGAGTNPAISEFAILGPCSGLSASTFVNITEVTTVAAAFALAPFANVTPGIDSVGTSATNLQGLANAAGAAGNLANTVTGMAHATGDFPGIVPPTAEINTLADILASCINQGTTGNPAGGCAALFAATTPPGGAAPTDTGVAAFNIAQHPGNNTAALFALVPAIAPFQPTLSTAPADFSVALGFNGGGITVNGTTGVAIDAQGNAWITTGNLNPNVHSLTEISPTGVYLSGSTVAASTGFGVSSLNFPIGVAIDQSGAVYVCNGGGNGNLLKFDTMGVLQSTITAASFNGVNGIAIDGLGDPWISNFGTNGTITEITTAGVEATHSPFNYGGTQGVDVAIDPLAAWVVASNGAVGRVDLTSFAVTTTSTGGPNGGAANDHANNLWIATVGNGSFMEFSDSGVDLVPFGGLHPNDPTTVPQNIIIDGLGNVFAGSAFNSVNANKPGSLIELSNSGTLLSPSLGYSGSNVIPVVPSVPGGIGIDGSGNVWIAGGSNGTAVPIDVAEIVGIAAPVVTPRSVAATNNTIGMRP